MERSRTLDVRLAEYVVLRSRTQAKAVCAQYDSIVSRVSAQSQNTRQLVDLQRYIDSITYTELVDLKERLRVTAENVLFLIENAPLPGGASECFLSLAANTATQSTAIASSSHSHLLSFVARRCSAEDIRMHKLAFTWPEMILPILSGAEQRLQKEHEGAESHLDKWLKEYTERLVALAKAVREFNTKATMGDAETYVAELEDIQKRLLAAIDEVSRALSLLTRINLIELTYHELE